MSSSMFTKSPSLLRASVVASRVCGMIEIRARSRDCTQALNVRHLRHRKADSVHGNRALGDYPVRPGRIQIENQKPCPRSLATAAPRSGSHE